MSYVSLSVTDVAVASLLILFNAVISWAFRLGLARGLAVSAVRMVVQLALVGVVLKLIFASGEPALTVLAGLVMVLAATYEVSSRQQFKLSGFATHGLSGSTLLLVGTFVTLFAVGGVIRPSPWFAPQYALPVLGMVLGNALTGVSLVLDTMSGTARRERPGIEARLALGATRFEALSGVMRQALKTAMVPILNAMAASGVVWLPGMMTGQIMAGADPLEASKYQIVIMALIAGGTSLAVLMTALGSVYLLTDERHRLRVDRLRP